MAGNIPSGMEQSGIRRLYLGTSGYVYPHWRHGVFYPEGLRQREELAFYGSRFNSVELNAPFYRLPTIEHFARWRDATPGDFIFAVKASRLISHYKRLRQCGPQVTEFLAAARGLGSKLGVILCQLPPTFELDLRRLEEFLRPLPDTPSWVFEFRHPSWLTDAVLTLLTRYRAGFCIPVGGRLGVEAVAASGGLGYFRFHQGRGKDGRFTNVELERWAEEIEELLPGRTVYVFFNNDWHGFAPHDALRLRGLLEEAVNRMPVSRARR